MNHDRATDTRNEKVRSAEKETERKVRSAMCNLKLLDFNFGEITSDRIKMVRTVVRGLKEEVHPENRTKFDRILRRTRIQILGRTTEMRRGRDKTVYTVPILLECQDKVDADELDTMLRRSGYFCSFHWPQETMEFVNKIRDEVRRVGYDEQGYYVKIRPEDRAGEVRIRAEVKEKNGGRWQMAAVWKCPPTRGGCGTWWKVS